MPRKKSGRKSSAIQPPESPEASNGDPARNPAETAPKSRDGFPIAAIGASAGGIEATSELLSGLSPDAGIAVVLVQHLDPKHHSMLAELLSKKTSLPVSEVIDGMAVEPNHVYVIPPNASMSIAGHTLKLRPREDSGGLHMSVDQFMRSLAEQQGSRAIGVILSGSGTDGTLGMAEIQAQGGMTFAQDQASAKYDSMPRSAITAGCVDCVLPPLGIARELARIARHPYVAPVSEPVEVAPSEGSGLSAIFQLLRRSAGVDFTHYRHTTILRRIQRRMVVHKIEGLANYVRYVQSNPAEVKALYQDILINVTSFFRNHKVFDALKSEVFPALLKADRGDGALRIWTPGCASGEETYSLAIALLEFLGDKASHMAIQFFGTDVSDSSIAKARAGVYPENIKSDLTPERLRRFFTRVEGGYRISKNIRDMCIFAQHNVLNDPPFSQMDLVCCRNLLIYLEPILQSKVISLFHYATRPGGYLILGTSEGIGASGNLFSTVDRTNKIFSKKPTAGRQRVAFTLAHPMESGYAEPAAGVRPPGKQSESGWNYLEVQKEFDRRLLTQYAPATVFINDDLEVVHTRGNINRYLKLPPGRASLSILKMAREGLLLDLRNAISRARKDGGFVRKRNVQIKNGDGDSQPGQSHTEQVRFEVAPVSMSNAKELYFMIVFQDEPAETRPANEKRGAAAQREYLASAAGRAKLEQELAATKEYLQSVIETQEATNEELQSANEEILSGNEELQSTNEELETAKEELQSANEELTTVNDELRSRNTEITQVNTDLTNLFSSIDVAVIIVGADLTIRRFTAEAQKFLGLIPGDIGRPLMNINPTIEIPGFQALVLQVIAHSQPIEKDLRDLQGRPYRLKILPYRALDNRNDGVVITIIATTAEAPNPARP